MISRERNIHPTVHERRAIRSLISARPIVPDLRVGYHLRNDAERKDLLDLLDALAPDRIYTGLVGSRLVGKIAFTEKKLKKYFRHILPPRIIRGIVREWPLVAEFADGRKPLELPGVRHFELTRTPASKFFYDIDVVVVPKEFGAQSILQAYFGERSGTWMDIFIVSQEKLLQQSSSFYISAFLGSHRLRSPFGMRRKVQALPEQPAG